MAIELQLKHASAAKKSDMNKNKNIKIVTICRDTRSAKAWKQGRDDSIKQFSTQPHPTYPSTLKICRVKLCTELFYAIILPCFHAFC